MERPEKPERRKKYNHVIVFEINSYYRNKIFLHEPHGLILKDSKPYSFYFCLQILRSFMKVQIVISNRVLKSKKNDRK